MPCRSHLAATAARAASASATSWRRPPPRQCARCPRSSRRSRCRPRLRSSRRARRWSRHCRPRRPRRSASRARQSLRAPSRGDSDLSDAPSTIAPPVDHPRSRPDARPPARVGAEDSALASIVGGITIPASELGVAPLPGETRAQPDPEPVRIAAAPPVEAKPTPKPAPKAETPKPGAKPPAKPGAATADASKGKKKAETPKPKPKPPAEPARAWVQLGIGQDESLLPRTWAKIVKANPAEFRGKSGWWTPLRATNRLLTGPFKNATEAQAFVNTLKKAGVSAYAFTSEAGQKVTKLPVK
ncbi:MAG: SPOR domain-containing protein [Pseudomonadota bacterium]